MRKTIPVLVLAMLVLTLMFGALTGGGGVTAAPLAAPTPVSVTHPQTIAPELFTLMNAAITADTRGTCVPMGAYNVADIEYTLDQSTTNTVTLTLQHTNGGVVFADGATVVSNNAADANSMIQAPLYGRLSCLYADVSNTNTLTVTVTAWVK